MSSYVRPARDPALRFQDMGLEDDEKALLETIDGTLTLRQCLANAPLSEQRALVAASAMLSAGVLETEEAALKQPLPSARAAESPSDDESGLPVASPRERRATAAGTNGGEVSDGLSRDRLAAHLVALRGQDHFSALGLLQAASPTQIERAYGKLAREYHPDR